MADFFIHCTCFRSCIFSCGTRFFRISKLLSLFQVDQGLQTGLTPGMKLEVCVRAEADSPYWVANIITTCGQLLLLRYEGYQDDRRADFWCDLMTADLHPLGWSRQHGKAMRAPEGEALAFFIFGCG